MSTIAGRKNRNNGQRADGHGGQVQANLDSSRARIQGQVQMMDMYASPYMAPVMIDSQQFVHYYGAYSVQQDNRLAGAHGWQNNMGMVGRRGDGVPDIAALSLSDNHGMNGIIRSPMVLGEPDLANEALGYIAMPPPMSLPSGCVAKPIDTFDESATIALTPVEVSMAAYTPVYWDDELVLPNFENTPIYGQRDMAALGSGTLPFYPYAQGYPPMMDGGSKARGRGRRALGPEMEQYPPNAMYFSPPPHQMMGFGRVVRQSNGAHHPGRSGGDGRPPRFGRQGSSNQADKPRSKLLEEFRAAERPNLTLEDLKGHMVEFSSDQHGSRLVQKKLEEASDDEKEIIFAELRPQALELMTDVFGNYVVQKLLEHGTESQKTTLCDLLRGKVMLMAMQMYGCRTVQKAIEVLPEEMQLDLIKELRGNVLKCIKDQNGNHVIQKCIERVSPERFQFVVDDIQGTACALSMHPYGCRVVQRVLEHGTETQVNMIMEELRRFALNLVQDQYGNYVIQHILERGRPEDKEVVIDGMINHVLLMSQHKFASNVVEKCLTYGNQSQRQAMINEVLRESNGEVSSLYLMVKDQYANYVVQKMLDVAEESTRQRLLERLKPYLQTLRRFTYGKHIISKVEKQGALQSHVMSSVSTKESSSEDASSVQSRASDLEQSSI